MNINELKIYYKNKYFDLCSSYCGQSMKACQKLAEEKQIAKQTIECLERLEKYEEAVDELKEKK